MGMIRLLQNDSSFCMSLTLFEQYICTFIACIYFLTSFLLVLDKKYLIKGTNFSLALTHFIGKHEITKYPILVILPLLVNVIVHLRTIHYDYCIYFLSVICKMLYIYPVVNKRALFTPFFQKIIFFMCFFTFIKQFFF